MATQTEIRAMDDEALDAILDGALIVRLRTGVRLPVVDQVYAEQARRAEIRMCRRMDVEYGDNRYDFNLDNIGQPHDASWYESRQTEAEWLQEMGR